MRQACAPIVTPRRSRICRQTAPANTRQAVSRPEKWPPPRISFAPLAHCGRVIGIGRAAGESSNRRNRFERVFVFSIIAASGAGRHPVKKAGEDLRLVGLRRAVAVFIRARRGAICTRTASGSIFSFGGRLSSTTPIAPVWLPPKTDSRMLFPMSTPSAFFPLSL